MCMKWTPIGVLFGGFILLNGLQYTSPVNCYHLKKQRAVFVLIVYANRTYALQVLKDNRELTDGMRKIIGESFANSSCLHVLWNDTPWLLHYAGSLLVGAEVAGCWDHVVYSHTAHTALALLASDQFGPDHRVLLLVAGIQDALLSATLPFLTAQVAITNGSSLFRWEWPQFILLRLDKDTVFRTVPAHSPYPNLHGRQLRVATFECPPFSYLNAEEVFTSDQWRNSQAEILNIDPSGFNYIINGDSTLSGIDEGGTIVGVKSVSGISHSYSIQPIVSMEGVLDGVEMNIFLEAAHRLNFTWEIHQPLEKHKWGRRLSNGTWSGGVKGALVANAADIGFCVLFVSSDLAGQVEFLSPWSLICNTFFVPRPLRLAMWRAVILPFTAELWGVLLLATIVVTLVFYLTTRVTPGYKLKQEDLSGNLIKMIGVLVLSSYPPSSSQQHHLRSLMTCWTLFALIITAAYCSKLVSHLTVPLTNKPLDTVEELVKAEIYWAHDYRPDKNLILNPENPWHLRFMERFVLLDRKDEQREVFEPGCRAYDGYIVDSLSVFLHDPGQVRLEDLKRLRIMRECTSVYYTTLVLSRDFPFQEGFNKVIGRLVDSGAVIHLQEDVLRRRADPLNVKLLLESDSMGTTDPIVLKLSNVQGAFIILFTGSILATAVYVSEIVTFFAEKYDRIIAGVLNILKC